MSSKNIRGRIVQEKCGTTNDLLWNNNEKKNNGTIIKSKTWRQMDNAGRQNKNGNPIFAWFRNNTPAQVWVIEYAQEKPEEKEEVKPEEEKEQEEKEQEEKEQEKKEQEKPEEKEDKPEENEHFIPNDSFGPFSEYH